MNWLLSLLVGFLRPGQPAATRAAGVFNGVMVWGAIAAAVAWLIGPGRVWEITLRGWEIFAVIFFGMLIGVLGHTMLNIKPPDR